RVICEDLFIFHKLVYLTPGPDQSQDFCEFLFEFHNQKKTSLVRNKLSLTRLIKNTTPAVIGQPFL
ncbi:hypothetical protein, partial [Ileibacterium valens]|uniref:hypothetical protein n=1 Tax=Ileibacterium valens TaxID=1862668 RepID=UPI00272D0077